MNTATTASDTGNGRCAATFSLKRFLLLILFIMLLINDGNGKPAGPDFAFPEKVAKTADSDLKAALRTGNGKGAVEALIRFGLAKSMVNSDSLPSVLERIASVTEQEKDPVIKSLLYCLSAGIYADIYSNDRSQFDRREATDVAGDDYKLWSTSQFLDKVVALTDLSMADPSALAAAPLKEYAGIVDFEDKDLIFYPSLLDFIATQGIDNLGKFNGNLQRVLNPALLADPADSRLWPGKDISPAREILSLYASLTSAHEVGSAPWCLMSLRVRQFVNRYLFENWTGNNNIALRQELIRLYRENENSEFSALFLLNISKRSQNYYDFIAAEDEDATADANVELYRMLRGYLDRFHASLFADDIYNSLQELTRGDVRIKFPDQVLPDTPVKVKVNGFNARKIRLDLYDVTQYVAADDRGNWYNGKLPARPSDTAELNFDRTPPFVAEGETTLTFPGYGKYVIVMTVDGVVDSGSHKIICCSGLSLATLNVGEENSAWVVDAMSGAPADRVALNFFPWSRKAESRRSLGVTDESGELPLKIDEYGYISASRGNDRYAPGLSVSSGSSYHDTETLSARLFTSLGLYRPGDTMEFSLVAYRENNSSRRIAEGERIRVMLFDANYQSVDTVTVVTDSWGRASGSFTLPSTGLTGSFSLRAIDNVANTLGNTYFEVSDYKLPTFEVVTEKVTPPATVADPAVIKGYVRKYSGFPVADAKISVKLTVSTGWWWNRSTSPVFYTAETVSGSDGEINIEIPAEVISGSPAPGGLFNVAFDVTSPDGETHAASASFTVGNRYSIIANIPSEISLDKPFAADLVIRDMSDETLDEKVDYIIYNEKDTVAQGSVTPGDISGIFKKLPVGSYKIKFSSLNPKVESPETPGSFIIYRNNDKSSPVEMPLWLPYAGVTADTNGDYYLTVASDSDDAWVRLVVTAAPGRVIEKRWFKPAKGIAPLKLSLPANVDQAWVRLTCVKDFETYDYTTEVKRESVNRGIKVAIETFRDKVLPGNTEKITLRVKPVGETSPESAVMLDMSNKAIDILASNSLRMPGFTPRRWASSVSGWSFGISSDSYTQDIRFRDPFNTTDPEFQFYGQSFIGYRYGRGVFYRMKAMNMSASIDGEEMEMAVKESSAPMMAAAPTSADDMYYDSIAGGEAREDRDSGESADESADGDNKKMNDSSYRPSEIALAFFRPLLNTAADGSLEISYEVPQANTTWILRAMAYNRELLVSDASTEIISSKPLMVSQNAPRFLRSGDEVVLLSSVMNNTDSVKTVSVLSQLLTTDGKLLREDTVTVEIAPMGSAVVKLPFSVDDSLTGILYRVKGSDGDYTDGEQCCLPVLPSAQDVVESQIFYLAPDDSRFEMNLPEVGDGGRAFLNFTENPSWQVVSALPGLRRGEINSSVEASAALFSAAVADGILRANPEIAMVLRRWSENPGDSALVSALEKNEQLKTILLSATPWVTEAMSDTERMQRLSLLFDRKNTSKVISDAIDRLVATRVDGGWCWTEKYPVKSDWCTEVILEELGELNANGWLPADPRLKSMINNAVTAYDRETAAAFRKYPKADYWLYVMIRDRFPEIKLSTAASKVVEAQVQKGVASWRDASVVMKGVYALMLSRHGYKATGRQILASLREYATSSPEKGMWWQQLDRYSSFWSFDRIGMTSIILDAFNALEPGSADVEKIRQWLILNKTNNDWGNAIITTQTITSILSSGRPLKVNTRGTAIHIGDTLLQPQSQEYATGAFTEQITSLLAKPATMVIDRQADYPSVGGVVMMRRLQMDEVKAVGCEEVSVEKSLTVFNGNEWVATDSFAVGDRVRVGLTLRVEDDLSYVVITDSRAAGLEPESQLPQPIYSEGLCFYRENRDDRTNIFIDFLPRGVYYLTYDLFASQEGRFASGTAQVQSLYNPIVAAHSGGRIIGIVAGKEAQE